MNFSLNWTGTGAGGMPCLEPEVCEQACLQSSFKYNYEFVWIFIVAFIFQGLSMIIFEIPKLDADWKYKLVTGCKYASYILNLGGILYFIYMKRYLM